MYNSDFSVTTFPLPSAAPYSTLPCVLSFCCKFRSTGKTQPLLLAGNKQHKEIPKTERQNTQKRTLGKNKDQLNYNMHTQFMCPSIYPFPNFSYRSEEMVHCLCWPQFIFTQQYAHLVHVSFPYITFQTPLTGQKRWGHRSCWTQFILTQQLYSILSFFGTTSSKFSKAWQKQIYRILMKLPSHTTILRIKNPPNFISIRIKTFFQRYDYTYIAVIFEYVFVLSNPHEI